ncbi:hypothetical protein [Marinobacterium sediminicola]|uniref:Tetratricopeptide repeat protein n=1 Tax=Marinobacterium sediminicola TaxID=518898 RepID=A0ABY1RYE7_9GAMM|nr:hypothetical protein [Marinobacterium sediminicola]ULG68637.1 hypothetical protein LN244_13180 [Marinobacterium sediminicola]SMR73160.1 hypothetical protein SAMN04487964_103101 [Marinobacterium sediminicola]
MKRMMRSLCLSVGLPVWLIFSAGAMAETVQLSPGVLQQLSQAQQALAEGNYPQAEKVLKALSALELSKPARAYTLQFRGSLALVQQQSQAALQHFAAAYALDALPQADQRRLLHTVAQLQMGQEQWRKGVASLQQWMQQVRAQGGQSENIRAEDYLMLAQGYSRLDQWSRVIQPVRTAIQMKGRAPEDWYRLQLAAHFQLKQWKGATSVLELLVNCYPQKARYWEQLASVYQIRDRHADALSTLRAAWLAGQFSQEHQYIWLAQMLLQQGLPQRAAELLDEAMTKQQVKRTLKHERLLAQTQLQAKLYTAGRATLHRIAQRKPDYQTWRQLAYLDMQLKHWDAMKRSIDQAVVLKPDAADLFLLSGIADVNRSNYDQARASFIRAHKHDATRAQAQSWLNYLDQVAGPRRETGRS